MKTWLFFLFLFISTACSSQNAIKLKFDKSVPPDQSIVFYTYDKTVPQIFKTFTRGSNDSMFIYGLQEAGLCMLTVMESMSMAEFIYNPKENITIEINYADLISGNIIIKHSRDNVCYSDLQKINEGYDPYLDSLQYTRMSIPVSTPDYYKKCLSADSLYEKIAREKNARLTTLQFYYIGTFTSQTLVPFSLIPVASPEEKKNYQTPYSYIRDFYFKYAVSSREALRHHTIYNFINRYFSVYTFQDDVNIKRSIDSVLSAFRSNEVVSEEIIRFLMQSFIDQQLYKYAWYTLAHSTGKCPVDWFDAGQDFISNRKHTSRGSVVDDIVLKDINDDPVSLYKIISKSKKDYTALFFWSGNCEMNNFQSQRLIQSFSKGKINVFAIYLGNNKEEWKTLVKEYGLQNFINVSELLPLEKSILLQRFMVTSAPMTYILTKERKIKDISDK